MKIIISVLLCLVTWQSHAEEHKSLLGIKKFTDKNINKGDHEFGGNGLITIDDGDFNISLNGHYRYFFADGFSAGLMLNFSGNQHVATLIAPGLSTQWYFAEYGKWAFSVGQDIYHTHRRFLGSIDHFRGTSKLGAHYFVDSSLSLDFNLNYDYDLENKPGAPDEDLFGSFGISVHF